ncbi:MAG: hypothetical protein E6J79_13825 [Deltaproteobacteria bacterium]|nr:MAG: hypothetical protein E6J79_13825 [Deltaproteobacteria bacterium]
MGSRVGTIHVSQRRFALLCILAYVVLAWAARFDMRLGQQIASLVYPLDTFSMYGGMPGEDRSHLLVRDAEGEVYRISDFRAYRCLEPLTGSDVRCAGRLGIPYHYEELIHYIETHQGQGELAVELITRTWDFPPGERVRTADCVVAHCTVAR